MIDKLNSLFIEIIEAVTPDSNLLMWKFPDNDKEIKNGAKLTVRESQAVMFLNEGKLADIFEPGFYTLNTENIPVLSKILAWKYGFQSPFKADVYFFNTKIFVNNKWGTPSPILMNDPQFGQIRIRAFGSFDVRISDIALFFRQYAGSYDRFTIYEMQHELRDYIAPKFAEVLANENITITDVAGSITALSKKVEPFIKPYLESFGIELTQFVITSVTLPEDVIKHYDKITNMNMVSDIDKYTQFNTAQAISEKGTVIHEGTTNAMAMDLMFNQLQHQTSKQSSNDSIREKLKAVKDWFDSGLIDEEEYREKKAELLKQV